MVVDPYRLSDLLTEATHVPRAWLDACELITDQTLVLASDAMIPLGEE